jgi:hypothetical protein
VALSLEAVQTGAAKVVPSGSTAESHGALGDVADLTLELLMRQALEVPGAATALLEAYAAQSRALRLVQEADARGAASLPTELRHRLAAAAARTPAWLSTSCEGVRA